MSQQTEILETLQRLEEKINALYEWASAVDCGIRELRENGGMTGMMARSMLPAGIVPLPPIMQQMAEHNGYTHR